MDWSLFANVIAAVGGVLSVCATSYIAIHENRRANNAEWIAAEVEDVHRSQLVAAASAHAAALIDFIEGFKTYFDYDVLGLRNEDILRSQYELAAARVRMLQQYPGIAPTVFAKLGELATSMTLPAGFKNEQIPFIAYTLNETVKDLRRISVDMLRWL